MGIKQHLTGILLFTLVFLTGCALSVISVIWIREFLLLYGINMASLVVVTTAFLADFAAGSRIFGRISDKVSNQTNLLAVLLSGVALFSFGYDFFINIAGKISGYLTSNISDDLFSVSLLRLLIAAVFLIPVSFLGGVYPVFSRLITRHLSQAGQKTGIIIALLSYGALAGFLTLVFYFPYKLGYNKTLIAAASVIAVITLMLKLISHETIGSLSYLKWPLAMKAKRSGMLQKNYKVLEAEPKLVRTLLWVFTLEGIWAMVLLLLWIRVLLNVPGALPIEVISAILLTGLFAFGSGSLIFRGLTVNSLKKFHVLGLTYIATGITVVISIAAFSIFGNKLIAAGESLTIAGRYNIHPVPVAFVLMFLPVLLLGGTFPMASRLYPRRLQKTGQRVGFLNFIFITGSLGGLVTASFILIPLFGIYNLFFAVAVLSIFTGLMLFMRDSRYRRSFRLVLLILAAGMCVFLRWLFPDQVLPTGYISTITPGKSEDARQGPASTAYIIHEDDRPGDIYVNGRLIAGSDEKSLNAGRMVSLIAYIMNPSAESAYVSGFGTGIIPSELYSLGLDKVIVSEPYPEIVALSAGNFSGINKDVLTREELELTQEDARSLLGRYDKELDIIILFQHQTNIRPDLYTSEFYSLTYSKLDSSGIFCRLIPIKGIHKNDLMKTLKTIGTIYPNLSIWHTGEDYLTIAATKDSLWNYCDIIKRYNSWNRISGGNNQPIESFLGNLMLGNNEIMAMTENYEVFTDDRPVIFSTDEESISGWDATELFAANETDYGSIFSFSERCVGSVEYTFNIINSYRKIILSKL